MKTEGFTIGWLAKQTNTKVQTIRYYEQIGLMPAPPRSSGNRRLYGARYVERLAFIRHSRELGFSLDEIRELLSLVDNPKQTCEVADSIARAQLKEVESRINRLHALQIELRRMIKECRGGQVSDCRVIEVLADHKQCLHKDHIAPEN
jgi:DNA-binding transcriptional MerR regulator